MTTRQPTIMIMAGGTGGHIMPGLAVALALRERGWRIQWLGNPDAMEGRLVPPQGIPLSALRFSGVRGKGWRTLLRLPFALGNACAQVWRHFSAARPDVVLGMGGYVAFPGGVVAALRGVPLVLHEQNAVAGMTNRVLSRLARRVLTGFPATLGGETTGNPVRGDLQCLPQPEARLEGRAGALRILVVGGSLGAQALNTAVPEALREWGRLCPGQDMPQVVHQSGEKHIAELRAAYRDAGVTADCRPFIDDMAAAYADADLVICRSGAMTVAEIAAVGVAALFVPFPHAVDDHQTRNARFLADGGAGWICPQTELTPVWLAQWLSQRTRPELLEVARQARARARPEATQRIADVCAELVKGNAA